MPYASNTTVASGTTPNVAVPFSYIEQSDVNVSLNGVVVPQNTLTWTSASVIQLPSTPAAGVVIEVYRTTNANTLTTQFQDPSVLEGSDLNNALLQMLFVTQEAFDAAAVTATELTTITTYVNTAMASAAESATAAANSAAAAAGVGAGSAYITGGNWDASAGTFPGGGTAPKNILYRVSVAGTVGGVAFNIGDSIYSLVTNASATVYAANWQQILGSVTQAAINAVGGGWGTGDVKLTLKTTADVGWVLCNDTHIGNVGSGAEYASVSALALYTLLWANSLFPVTGGHGASAAADWAALKALQLPVMAGRALAVGGAGSGLTSRALGATVGEETHLLTTTEMPSHAHAISITEVAHSHTIPSANSTAFGTNGSEVTAANTGTNNNSPPTSSVKTGLDTLINAATAAATTGGGGAHNNMQPTSFLNAMIKL